MLIGFLLAFLITDKAWQKFQNSPTFTSLVLNKEELKIVYPTVTVCSKSAINLDYLNTFIDKNGFNDSDVDEMKKFLMEIPNLSYGTKGLKSLFYSDSVDEKLKRAAIGDLRIFAFKLSLDCKEIFHQCQFKAAQIDCCESFLPIYSEHGLCYTFNSRSYGSPREE
jgi:Amiloride-sensitive sodium channel